MDAAFDRVNRHRALAELVIYNRNWLPGWITRPVLTSFCDHGERYLGGMAQPPLFVRAWWAVKHLHFRWATRTHSDTFDVWLADGELRREHPKTTQYLKLKAKQRHKTLPMADAVIPLAPGQRIEYIPVQDGSDEIEVIAMDTGNRRKVKLTAEMKHDLRSAQWDRVLPELTMQDRIAVWHHEDGNDYQIDKPHLRDRPRIETPIIGAYNVTKSKTKFKDGGYVNEINYSGSPIIPGADRPSHIADYPRPDCPKCGRSHPQLGTPLNRKKNGWDASYFTCSDHKCGHRWTFKKTFPFLVEDPERAQCLLKGTNIAVSLKALGMAGLTVDELNEGLRKLALVPYIEAMGPEKQNQIGSAITALQSPSEPLAKLTPEHRLALARALARH